MLYWKIQNKSNTPFTVLHKYSSYQAGTRWLRRRPYNFKYIKFLEILIEKNRLNRTKITKFYQKFANLRFLNLFHFSTLYYLFFNQVKNNLFFFKKMRKKKKIFHLVLSFKKKRLFISLFNKKKKKNFIFISQGMFLKFFEKKKSLKKNKNIKLLMAKFLRKIFLLSSVKNLIIFIKNTPLHLIEFLSFLNTPIIHKFINPSSGQLMEEKNKSTPLFKTLSFIFIHNLDFSSNKTPKKGRIKRKITRKIIINNNLTD